MPGSKNIFCKAINLASKTPLIGKIFTPKPKVSLLRMSGVIRDTSLGGRSGISFDKYAPLIEKAFKPANLKAVALIINSPGGSPAQSSLIAEYIRDKAKEKNIPVLSFVEDVAASGGYWLACAGEEIYTQEMSIVGSIGVISASFGMQQFIEKHGIERRIHTSGKEKSFLDPFVEEKPSDVKRLKELQKNMHEIFKSWVKFRRESQLKGSDKELFEGAFWTGSAALEKGLIDGFGEARTICKKRYGENTKFIEINPKKKWIPGIISAQIKNHINLQASTLPESTITAIEDRIFWSRYGL